MNQMFNVTKPDLKSRIAELRDFNGRIRSIEEEKYFALLELKDRLWEIAKTMGYSGYSGYDQIEDISFETDSALTCEVKFTESGRGDGDSWQWVTIQLKYIEDDVEFQKLMDEFNMKKKQKEEAIVRAQYKHLESQLSALQSRYPNVFKG